MLSHVLGSQKPIFDAQCPVAYRNWPNGRRVATSTSRLTAYLRIVLHGRIRVISNRGKGESPPAGPPARPRGQRRPERHTGKRTQQQAGRSKQAAAGEQQVASREPAGQASGSRRAASSKQGAGRTGVILDDSKR